MYRAQPVGPEHRLYQVVARMAQRANLPMPKVYVIPDPSPNAFATGRNPDHAAVAATEGILRILSDTELEGVIGHELTHVKHRDILISSIAATLAAAIMMIANMARWAAFFGGGRSNDRNGSNPIALLAMIILAPLAAVLIQSAISRSREYDADARRRADCRHAVWPGGCAQEAGGRLQADPARCEPGDGAHVHHQSRSQSQG